MQYTVDSRDGSLVEDRREEFLERFKGEACAPARICHPNVINVEHGWWFPELPGEEPWLHGAWESNANILTDDDPDICGQIHGGWPLRTALCKVYPANKY